MRTPRMPPKPRSDKGSIQLTDRDLPLLRFVADQYTIRLDQLMRLMDRPEPTARQWMNRMRSAGYLHFRAPLRNETTYLWVTRDGLKLLDLDYAPWELGPGQVGRLQHLYWITQVRLCYTLEDARATWMSERKLRAFYERERTDRAQKLGHLPDGYVYYHGPDGTAHGHTAIEVELTPKTVERTKAVLSSLLNEHSFYEHVEYYSGPTARNVVSQALNAWPDQLVLDHVYLEDTQVTLDHLRPLKASPPRKPRTG